MDHVGPNHMVKLGKRGEGRQTPNRGGGTVSPPPWPKRDTTARGAASRSGEDWGRGSVKARGRLLGLSDKKLFRGVVRIR